MDRFHRNLPTVLVNDVSTGGTEKIQHENLITRTENAHQSACARLSTTHFFSIC